MNGFGSGAVETAVRTIEAYERELGFEGVVTPHETLRAYAAASSGRRKSDLPAVETWHPVYLEETLQDFAGDVGHLCDRTGVSCVAALSIAFEIDEDDILVADGELDETLVITAISGDEMALSNLARAKAALVGINDGREPPSPTAEDLAACLRQLKALADALGLDGEKAILTGVGAWSAERRAPEDTIESDVVTIRREHAPSHGR